MTAHKLLHSEADIRARLKSVAREIATAPLKPDFAVAILAGAFVFAADLLRALAREGLSLPIEFLWLRSYADNRTGGEISVLVGPTEKIHARTVLLIDGVLDGGHTLAKAKELLSQAEAAAIITAVAVDKLRGDAVVKADHALFAGSHGFLIGYGMDDAGAERGLPYIAAID
ncbi:MAG TPA: phosphoribosyltransferase family protein [Rhizomicrobium sp.]|nr:phosphoribosyltransferase family protein [Rhizomicrobium sp.]